MTSIHHFECVAPALTKCPLQRRLLAYMIDVCVVIFLAVFTICASIVAAHLFQSGIERFQVFYIRDQQTYARYTLAVNLLPLAFGTLLILLYFVLALWNWGRTIGMRMCGCRLAALDGGKLRFRAVLVRESYFWGSMPLLMAADMILTMQMRASAVTPFLYALWALYYYGSIACILFDKTRRRALYDHIAGTWVVVETALTGVCPGCIPESAGSGGLVNFP